MVLDIETDMTGCCNLNHTKHCFFGLQKYKITY